MTRPCETTIRLANGHEITPEQINGLASGGETFPNWLCRVKGQVTEDEIFKIAEAICDNWKRYWDSC